MALNSETIVIKRSQINLNPYNIKNHSDEQVKLQKKNIKKIGYLGGIVWNETSGNLIDGHRRTQALDQIHKYDGTPETDYEIKVERVFFDEKTELEQMTYMATANSKADYNLIANYIDVIDPKAVGLSDAEYKAILDLKVDDSIVNVEMPELKTDLIRPVEKPPVTELPTTELTNEEVLQQHEEKPKMTREEVREQKQHCKDVNTEYMDDNDLFIVLSFENFEQKNAFCEALGFDSKPNMVIEGKDILNSFDL